jgi:hypothetical protein
MRSLIVLVVLAVLGLAAYRYLYQGEPPPQTVEQATLDAREAAGEAATKAREALQAAGQALGPAAQQAGEAVRQGAEQLRAGVQQLGQEGREAAADARSQVVDGVDLGNQMREAVGRARAALVGVTDAPAAEAALPTVRDADEALGQVQARLEALPAEARAGFAGLVAESLPALRDMVERVKAIDGTGPEVDQALDAMVARLEGWSRPPA